MDQATVVRVTFHVAVTAELVLPTDHAIEDLYLNIPTIEVEGKGRLPVSATIHGYETESITQEEEDEICDDE